MESLSISEFRTTHRNKAKQHILKGFAVELTYYNQPIAVAQSYATTDTSSVWNATTLSLQEAATEGGLLTESLLSGKPVVITSGQSKRPIIAITPFA
jgi:hypothetical protein